jgi:lycopene cyclase domain-containing protein
MQHWAYLAVLLGIVLGSLWLEFGLRTRVLRRARRLVLAIAPVLVVFLLWDAYAIDQGHWTFDPGRVTGLDAWGIPLEEVLFFVVVPLASILTLEAVRSARGWRVGDEPDRDPA